VILIGISGRRGVGKTALATYFVQNFGFQKLAFADSLKAYASLFFEFEEADFTDVKRKETKFKDFEFTPREFMIRLGDFLRFHDEDFFVKDLVGKLKNKKEGRYIVDDVRFPNELEALKKKDGYIIRLDRYEKNNPYGKNLDILSETALDHAKFDYHIKEPRNLDLHMLYAEADKIIKECK
jgi:hypothetical protein